MGVLRQASMVIVTVLGCAACSFPQAKPAPPQTPAQAQTPVYNPVLAQHDLDIGKFYQNRGDLDGAIARYKDALRYKPNFAEALQLLGQAYERKHDYASAIDYYQQYVKILPNTSESKKLRKRVAELQEKIKKNESGSH
jgi:tetratricopeptide (TPR) repeat protein